MKYEIHQHFFSEENREQSTIIDTRFIVTWNTFTGDYCLHEIAPVWCSGDKDYDDSHFINPDALVRIMEYHQNIEYHDPIFCPSWISGQIDFYEDYLVSFQLYKTIDDAKLAIEKHEKNKGEKSLKEIIND